MTSQTEEAADCSLFPILWARLPGVPRCRFHCRTILTADMLTISSKSRYGLQAVLSLAENHGHGLLQIKDISRRNNIPPQYLGQIFNQLVKADIIRSVRGKSGGYRLARPPEEITVLEILEVLEGNLELVGSDSGNDAIHDLLRQAEQALRKTFSLSLADLQEQQKKKQQVIFFDI